MTLPKTTTPKNSLQSKLEYIGLRTIAQNLDDFIARATKGRWSSHILMERLLKEATHEFGHTFNLYHCHNPGCVMNSSTYVEDIDEKSALFCRECNDVIISSKLPHTI